MNHDGMILLKKPEGITSFRALGILKKKLGTKKVGHTGTLDKFASGLLVILTGKMTKFAPFITGMDKTYEATFRFGETTDTLDPEGQVINTGEIPSISSIKDVILNNFLGKIEQVPPDFSAVHVNGKRAYQLKLSGDEFKIPPREITINNFEILNWDGKDLKVIISCSKGTYIRSIARDLGKLCNSYAYVVKLNRSVVGPFHEVNSVTGEDFTIENLVTPYNLITSLNKQIAIINSDAIIDIFNGKKMKTSYFKDKNSRKLEGEVALFSESKDFIAMIEQHNGFSKYLFVGSR